MPLGRKVRQISVRLDGGSPQYTAIWENKAAGEHVESYLDITSARLDQIWNDKVKTGLMGMVDYSNHFTTANGLCHNVILTTAATAAYLYNDKTADEIRSINSDMQKQGWQPYVISAADGKTGNAVRYAGIWRRLSGTYEVDLELDKPLFQIAQDTRRTSGWRLHRVQGYDNGAKFLAVLYKP